ncbi:ABC transporter ATP-binding protein/permease [Clostridium botulinum]|uniref:ABC transporter ATP-binding protein/permease n=1 Tax=Clostridium TaxID=1485 RepID=UPI000174E572|nr:MULTISPECIES: ABC transporter ATP-binding protein/permease [Clostridium]ACD52087.1 multidrug resistance protein 1 [Clostridium botulinum E3 str. Alaska E43]AJF30874.1 cysteine ABC transporter ATP-binding protein [Clostridium botulinum]MBN1036759.1 ABC transporter ATP-binding protein/permease [Clostridium botulinum]MBY6787896.1 ABC transporter ATP-binding protein/permease [Clostridium botulinum]MBY6810012.1 ABC transporter ATP-binding protein/permease [Clostridium botulinum]
MMINKRLINLCEDSKKYIIFTVLSSWIAILCNILIVFIIGNFINKIYSGITQLNILKHLNELIIISVLLSVRYISNILNGKFSYLASANSRVTLRELIYKKLLKLGVGYSNVQSTSTIVQVAVEGIEALEVYFGRYLPQFFYAVIAPITLFIFISFISIKTAVVFILCVPLIPISIIAIMKIAKKILKNYWNSYANLGDTFLDNLQGLTTLKVFNIDKERHKKMNEEAENFRKITMKVLSMQLNSINIMDLIAFGGAALGTIVALIEFKNGQILIGELLIIILLSSEFFIPLRLLGSYFHIAMNGMAACDKIFDLLDYKEKEKEVIKNIENKLEDLKITLENVSFTYDGKRKVINNINLEISNNGLTSIVGESGSGKSTIASLILNINSATNGKVKFNNIDIENINDEIIYKNISLVSTNSYIFNGTILENLLMGNSNASEEEINKALEKSRLTGFINSLDKGLYTEVGEGGSSLSGGQKQRLALARAILGNRDFIIFDEATSNIDIESEEQIWKSIYELAKEKTVLVISHRLANVRDSKVIYVMKEGQLIESGTHSELVETQGEYYKMINKQIELENIREVG